MDAWTDTTDLLDLYENRDYTRRERMDTNNLLLGHENVCGTTMTNMLEVAADLQYPSRTILDAILNRFLPQWCHDVSTLRLLDYDTAYSMLRADKEQLRRLRRNVAADPHNLLSHVVDAVQRELDVPRNLETGVFGYWGPPNPLDEIRNVFSGGSDVMHAFFGGSEDVSQSEYDWSN
jgi:hypothetical protein